jgi:uncharacterized membrane protein YqiK
MEKAAIADKQPQVIDAQLSIKIAGDKADAMRKEAGGIRDATIEKAKGEAFQVKAKGVATADAYTAQVTAIGQNNLSVIQFLERIASGNIRITPDTLVTGGDNQTGNLLNTFLVDLISKKTQTPKKPINKDQKDL